MPLDKPLYIKYKDTRYTRITIAVDRVSVKIGTDVAQAMMPEVTYKIGEYIKRMGTVEKTYRGFMNPHYSSMTFYNNSKKESKTVRL